jgi:hypothetical protein
MTPWKAMKQLNRHFDRWSARASNHVLEILDQAGEAQQKPGRGRHIGVWDLLRGNRAPGVLPATKEK